jgi:hypothetical protein
MLKYTGNQSLRKVGLIPQNQIKRKQKVETREGTTTEPDSEIHTDYSEDFEEDEPATSVNITIVQLHTVSLSTPSLRSPQVNGKPLRKSASVQMVGTDIEIEEIEMRPAPHEGPNDMFNMCMGVVQKVTETMGAMQQMSDSVVKSIRSIHSNNELSSGKPARDTSRTTAEKMLRQSRMRRQKNRNTIMETSSSSDEFSTTCDSYSSDDHEVSRRVKQTTNNRLPDYTGTHRRNRLLFPAVSAKPHLAVLYVTSRVGLLQPQNDLSRLSTFPYQYNPEVCY